MDIGLDCSRSAPFHEFNDIVSGIRLQQLDTKRTGFVRKRYFYINNGRQKGYMVSKSVRGLFVKNQH